MVEDKITDYIWTTRDGRRIPISQMSDRHVMNTYKMLIRVGMPDYPSFQGEMAQMMAEDEWERASSEYQETVYIFEREINKRGLDK